MKRILLIATILIATISAAQVTLGGGVVVSGGGIQSVAPSGLPPLFSTLNPTTTPTFQLLPFPAHTFLANCGGIAAVPTTCLIGGSDVSPNWYALDVGTVNALAALPNPAIYNMTDGLIVEVLPAFNNTTSTPTLNISGFGAALITKVGGAALSTSPSDLKTTTVALFIRHGSHWELQNPQSFAGGFTTNGTTTISALSGGILDLHLGSSFFFPGALGTGVVTNTTGTGAVTILPLQGSDANVLTAGTVAGTASPLCTDASLGATTVGCPSGSGVNPSVQAYPAYYSTANTLSGGLNPLNSLGCPTITDRAAAINTCILKATNSVFGDIVDARGELSTNNVVAHSMFPQNSTTTGTNSGAFNLWLPSGKFTTSVPQKIETLSSIVYGTGRGATNGVGATMIQASTVGAGWGPGLGSGTGSVTITCPGGWQGLNNNYQDGSCRGGFAVSGGTGYYYNPIVVFTANTAGCTTQPAQVLQIVDGAIAGIKDTPQGQGSDNSARGVGCGFQTAANATESSNTVTLTTVSGNWPASFTPSSSITVADCSTTGYNITATILSGGAGGTTLTYTDPTGGLGTVSDNSCQGFSTNASFVYTIYPGPITPGGLNMRTGQGGIFSPFVMGVGNPSDSYTEDTQLYNMALDCGAAGTTSTLGAGDMNTGLEFFGSQESSYVFGVKVTGCGIADFDVGGFSDQTQNLGPFVGTEVLSPSCPTPGTTYQGTPWAGTGSVGPLTISSASATASGVVTIVLSGNIKQITQGQSIEVSGIPNGTHGTIFSTSADSSGVPLSSPEVHSYYEVTSTTCTNCNTFKYQVAQVGQTDTPTGSYSAGIITPWPVSMRWNSSAITSGLWHATLVGCFGGLPGTTIGSQRVSFSINGLGGVFQGIHSEKTLTLAAIGDVNWAQGNTLINNQNTTLGQTSYLISNQNNVTDLVIINSGAAKTGAGNMPATLLDDLWGGNVLTSAQQSWIPLYIRGHALSSGSPVAYDVFSMVDPSTANSQTYQNGVNLFSGLLAGYNGSTNPVWTMNTATGIEYTASTTQKLLSDVTGIVATTPGTVEFTWGALPVSQNRSFRCFIMYQQATATGGVGFAVQGATHAPTRLDAWADIASNTTGTIVGSAVANLTSTTATPFSTATPTSTATTYTAKINGTIQVGSSASTLNILAFTGSGSDAVTLKAGSYCSLEP